MVHFAKKEWEVSTGGRCKANLKSLSLKSNEINQDNPERAKEAFNAWKVCVVGHKHTRRANQLASRFLDSTRHFHWLIFGERIEAF